ncbi:hypothetical protein COR53_09460 [Staphylococcus pettenkoferi]|nr:hypothetical protein COR53_09460 [Staphylococcus pettenkoferi]
MRKALSHLSCGSAFFGEQDRNLRFRSLAPARLTRLHKSESHYEVRQRELFQVQTATAKLQR